MYNAQTSETGTAGILVAYIFQAFEANSDPCLFSIIKEQIPLAESQQKVTRESLLKRSENADRCEQVRDLPKGAASLKKAAIPAVPPNVAKVAPKPKPPNTAL